VPCLNGGVTFAACCLSRPAEAGCYNPAKLWATVTKHGYKHVYSLSWSALKHTSHDPLHKITKDLHYSPINYCGLDQAEIIGNVIHFPSSSKPRQSGLIRFTLPVYCWTLFCQTWDSKQGRGG